MNLRWLRLLGAGALALSSLLAHAQYSWLDDKGARVYSDRPPPPGTPAGRILKAPHGVEPATAPAAPGWKQREADYRERSAQRDKEEREADARRRKERDAQCTWARTAQKQLEASRRLEWKNEKGEQEMMSDETRAREKQRVQQILSNC
jgi:hypothetical protein